MKNIAMALIAAYLAMELSQIGSADAESSPNSQMETVIGRLNLSDHQKALAEPILYQGFEERTAILQSAGILPGTKPRISQLMKVRSPLMASQANTETQLSNVLSEQQMAEFRAIVEEIRKQMREKLH